MKRFMLEDVVECFNCGRKPHLQTGSKYQVQCQCGIGGDKCNSVEEAISSYTEKSNILKEQVKNAKVRATFAIYCECGETPCVSVYHGDEPDIYAKALTIKCDCGKEHNIAGVYVTKYEGAKALVTSGMLRDETIFDTPDDEEFNRKLKRNF